MNLSPEDSIQEALNSAVPGDVIVLADGVYSQSFDSIRDGTRTSPIIVKGSKNAIINGDGRGRIIQVFHDNIHFEGFTVDGLRGNPNEENRYGNKLVYVQGSDVREGVDGFKALNMSFKNAGGECLRLRYFITNAEVAYSSFENCGVFDFTFNGGGKNGEAIYLGTSSNQWADGKNPTADPDASTQNVIHHNYFDTQGNECVDIKEGAYNNIVEYNICTGQKDPSSGGLDSRGDANIFRYNEFYNNVGAGVRLGGHTIDGHQYGRDNAVYGNKIYNNEYGAVKSMVDPQGEMCGNEVQNNGAGYGSFRFALEEECSQKTNPVPDLEVPEFPEEPIAEVPPVEEPIDVHETPADMNAVAIQSVTASSHDGNIPENTRDNNINTRWSAEGAGQEIQYELADVSEVSAVGISFYKGDQRVQKLSIVVSEDGASWNEVYSGESTGKTNDLQTFTFPATTAKYLKFVGYGNTQNTWNSVTEVEVYSKKAEETREPQAITVTTVTASSHDGNIPENTRDNNVETRWSAQGEGQELQYAFAEQSVLEHVQIAFYKGDQRVQKFSLQTSVDGKTWNTVYVGESSGATTGLQTFTFPATTAKYLKVIGQGNTENNWNSLTEVSF